jgi:hypothetical protein
MSLSNKSVNRIAAALVEEVAEELVETCDWIEFLHTNIGGIIVDKLGQVDDEILAELIMCVADRITLKPYTNE